jgi:hypothetical protein
VAGVPPVVVRVPPVVVRVPAAVVGGTAAVLLEVAAPGQVARPGSPSALGSEVESARSPLTGLA